MRKRAYLLLVLLAAVAITQSGCGARKSGPAGAAASESQPSPTPKRAAPLTALSGTYVMNEVESGGSTTMVPPGFTTLIGFDEAGTYERASGRKGVVDHSDSGQYRLENGDQLVLTIMMRNDKSQLPPPEERHTFSLSDDGRELRLTSSKGKTAVFRRLDKTPAR